jgi:hypothetical protein
MVTETERNINPRLLKSAKVVGGAIIGGFIGYGIAEAVGEIVNVDQDVAGLYESVIALTGAAVTGFFTYEMSS